MSKSTLLIAGITALVLVTAAHSPILRQSPNARTGSAIAMVDLPGGKFLMGLPTGEEHEQQSFPARTVAVRPFRIARTTVTFAQYDAFAKATGRALPQDEGFGRDTRPVINLDRRDVLDFVAWLNQGTGRHFRLPSEAEWEYAARGGSTTAYYWGDGKAQDYANLSVGGGRDTFVTTSPVGVFLPNGFGLFDMVGNVWQPVEDCRHPDLTGAPLDGKPWLEGPCDSRIARGGWYGSLSRGSRVTARAAVADSFRSMGLGLRLAEDMPAR